MTKETDKAGARIGTVEATRIEAAGLDPIIAYWHDYSPGIGSVTLTCFGCAWTAYFGGMMGRDIRTFFANCDVGYLVSKLGYAPTLKQTKKDMAYLERIVRAVKETLDAAR